MSAIDHLPPRRRPHKSEPTLGMLFGESPAGVSGVRDAGGMFTDLRTAPTVPECPVDRLRMTETIVGWRCPICGATEGR